MGKMEHESLSNALLKEFDNIEYFYRWKVRNLQLLSVA